MHAAQQEPGVLARQLSLLRASNLIRSTGVRLEDSVDPYHNRLRQAVISRLPRARTEHLHAQIAAAMEQLGPIEADRMALHLEGAGKRQQAAPYMARAAEEAALALAFDRAVELYRKALSAWPEDEREEQRRLQVARGEALANRGRSKEAAEAFSLALPDAHEVDVLRLRSRIASQLLRGGYTDEGMEALKEVAAVLGMRLPRTSIGALLSLLYRRMLLRLRGIGFRERDETQVSSEAFVRIDVHQEMSIALAMVDHIAYERAVAQFFYISTLTYLGELAELERRVPDMLRDAQARGDRYAEAGLVLGQNSTVFLNRDGPEAARERIETVARACALDQNFKQQQDALLARCQIDLYCGQGTRAMERVNAEWKALARSFIFAIPALGGEARHLRARTTLAAALQAPELKHHAGGCSGG